ncbi:Uncharacterised protein [Kingella potus]|uniref:Uncharacterized protein n=1 Tax=Kingella potus TaxID=265175 RepID=A0A377QYX9_9NEIS|nr:Uncharacterised protein [Kingella potus]
MRFASLNQEKQNWQALFRHKNVGKKEKNPSGMMHPILNSKQIQGIIKAIFFNK